jgi:hypothetical protein
MHCNSACAPSLTSCSCFCCNTVLQASMIAHVQTCLYTQLPRLICMHSVELGGTVETKRRARRPLTLRRWRSSPTTAQWTQTCIWPCHLHCLRHRRSLSPVAPRPHHRHQTHRRRRHATRRKPRRLRHGGRDRGGNTPAAGGPSAGVLAACRCKAVSRR